MENRKRKKGCLNPEKYKRNIIKKAKTSGDSHINWAGKRVPVRNDPDFIIKQCCKLKCLESINPPDLLDNIVIEFYNLKTKDEQDIYLQRMIEHKPIKRARGRLGTLERERKPKSTSFNYYLLLAGERKLVCKQAFINAHNVTTKRVRRICNLLKLNCVPTDKRGKKSSANAMPQEILTMIDDHIKSFPVRESHYTNRSYFYLSSHLNVKKMYNLFITKHPHLKDRVNYNFYWQHFKKNYSLSFGIPAKDTCSQCESLNAKIKSETLNDVAKRVAVAELLVHKNRSKKFYTQLEKSTEISKQNAKIATLCFDFMAVFDLPKIPVQEVYYFRQLSVNTFGIYNCGNNNMTCYVNHEGIARKTPDDVCSFILHYIHNFLDQEVEEIHFFCDNCAGQNKNHALIRMLMCIVELTMFKKIKLFFPQRGHSFLPCDRGFGLIKRKLKEFDRIYTVNQYIEDVVLKSSNIDDKFKVYQVDQTIIYDFQNWFASFYYKNKKSEVIGNIPSIPFAISNYHYFEFNNRDPKVIKTKEFIAGLASNYFRLRKSNENVHLPTQKLYSSPIPVLKAKMTDLQKLKAYIPDQFMTFWDEIYQWPTENRDERDIRLRN